MSRGNRSPREEFTAASLPLAAYVKFLQTPSSKWKDIVLLLTGNLPQCEEFHKRGRLLQCSGHCSRHQRQDLCCTGIYTHTPGILHQLLEICFRGLEMLGFTRVAISIATELNWWVWPRKMAVSSTTSLALTQRNWRTTNWSVPTRGFVGKPIEYFLDVPYSEVSLYSISWL